MLKRGSLLGAAAAAVTLAGCIGAAAPSADAAATNATHSAAAPSSAGAPARSCQTIKIPVALAPGQPENQRISAEYCTPDGKKPGAIDVFDHGATYNGTYWNMLRPGSPVPGTYVYDTLAAGRAVLDVDNLGSGQSSRPPGATLTINTAAYVFHQVIMWVRHTAGYRLVDEIGHSLGSATVVVDAGTWPSDPTRIVLTGFLSEITPNIGMFLASLRSSSYGLGYMTTGPGMRGRYFYDPATADPAVIADDEAHKDVVAAGELLTLPEALFLPVQSETVRAPVQFVVGQGDDLLCAGVHYVNCKDPAAVLAYEHLYFPRAASLSYFGVPDTGHDVALSTTADQSFAVINSWLNSH